VAVEYEESRVVDGGRGVLGWVVWAVVYGRRAGAGRCVPWVGSLGVGAAVVSRQGMSSAYIRHLLAQWIIFDIIGNNLVNFLHASYAPSIMNLLDRGC
jgi:hypothetical protein